MHWSIDSEHENAQSIKWRPVSNIGCPVVNVFKLLHIQSLCLDLVIIY